MRKKLFLIGCLLALLPGLWGFLPARAEDLPESAYVSGVVGHMQRYMLSCESRSAADWARFFGVTFGEVEFLNSLPRSDNPDKGFVGDPNDAWGHTPPRSYGVHAEPVAELLRAFGVPAAARRGMTWDELRTEIASGRPVMIWVIGAMWYANPEQYTDQEGQTTKVAPFEHSMILVGYSSYQVRAVDPGSGWEYAYDLGAFLSSWGVLGNMAVVYAPNQEAPEPEASPTPEPTATAAPTPTAAPPTPTPWIENAAPAKPSTRMKIAAYLPIVGNQAEASSFSEGLASIPSEVRRRAHHGR
jgi:uncharacterized protein YvpB